LSSGCNGRRLDSIVRLKGNKFVKIEEKYVIMNTLDVREKERLKELDRNWRFECKLVL